MGILVVLFIAFVFILILAMYLNAAISTAITLGMLHDIDDHDYHAHQ